MRSWGRSRTRTHTRKDAPAPCVGPALFAQRGVWDRGTAGQASRVDTCHRLTYLCEGSGVTRGLSQSWPLLALPVFHQVSAEAPLSLGPLDMVTRRGGSQAPRGRAEALGHPGTGQPPLFVTGRSVLGAHRLLYTQRLPSTCGHTVLPARTPPPLSRSRLSVSRRSLPTLTPASPDGPLLGPFCGRSPPRTGAAVTQGAGQMP